MGGCFALRCLMKAVDGAAIISDKREFLEVFSFNLPNLAQDQRSLRIPITALHKKHFLAGTAGAGDAVLAVISWSMRCLAEGKFPGLYGESLRWRQQKQGAL